MGGINFWWKRIKIYWGKSTGGNFSRWAGITKFLADGRGDWENPGGVFKGIEFPSVGGCGN